MRVLVCGSRYWKNRRKVHAEIEKRREEIDLLIQGGADGADDMALEIGLLLGIQVVTYHANWGNLGRKAGPIRNTRMLKYGKPDLVLAFHKNLKKSLGTLDMVSKAKRAGVEVRVIK